MGEIKILVVDDEIRIRKLLSDFLSVKGYDVIEAGDGEEAIEKFVENKGIALIILDVMMPKMDGFETVREIRKLSRVPVIMLTARGSEQDELQGFKLGVDEYITKPFSPKILTARVDAILRRTNAVSAEDIVCGNVSININSHIVKVNGETIELSYKEFELLEYFIKNRGIALSRENILNNVWDYDYFGDARTIDTHIKKIRAKLKGAGSQIKTIWGMGYKFEAE